MPVLRNPMLLEKSLTSSALPRQARRNQERQGDARQ
jgi:hypothetical protein